MTTGTLIGGGLALFMLGAMLGYFVAALLTLFDQDRQCATCRELRGQRCEDCETVHAGRIQALQAENGALRQQNQFQPLTATVAERVQESQDAEERNWWR